jgi:hypothetical protein
LLLRNPDPKLLAKIIDMDANGLKARSFDNLRTSLITAIYGQLPDYQRASFSRSTNIRISKALVSQGDTTHIPAIFHHLYNSTTWEPPGVWILLSLILHLTQHQAVEDALPLLQHLVRNQRLPAAALVGRGDPSHPLAPAITVQTIIIRSILSYRFYERARQLSTDLLDLLTQSKYHGPAWDLLLEVSRVNLVGGTKPEMQFVNDMLSGMATIPEAPVLPKSTVNDFIGSVKSRVGAGFYFSLDAKIRPKLTPANVLRLASLREYKITKKLEKEIARLSEAEWAPCRHAFEEMKERSWNMSWREARARA